MATKNKKRNKSKTTKATFRPQEDVMDDEAGSGRGDEEMVCDEGKKRGKTNDEEFSLEEVLRLGGTQADFILLDGLDDSNELVDGGKKGAIDDLEEGELERFISKLGIRALSNQQIVTDDTEEEEVDGVAEVKEKKAKSKETKDLTLGVKSFSTAELKAKDSQQQQEKKAAKKAQTAKNMVGKKAKQDVFEFQPRQLLLIKPGGKWFDLEYTSEETSLPQDPTLVGKYKTLAQRLLQADMDLYKNKKILQKGANSAWMKTVVSAGVLADRMAAMTVLIQDAPVHMLEHVESLVAMVKKKGSRRIGLMALDTMRELLLSNLLPENRKLRTFNQRPFDQLEELASGNRESRDRRLALWYFEHQLKHHVAEFVAALDEVAHDMVPTTKAKALATAFELLCNRPEQERALLGQVVNKLGDPEYKTAAKASHLLEVLLRKHPVMKAVVCCEVERLLFRPNISAKAQYYSICFLSQVTFSHDEAPLAAKLIALYFSFFRACVKKKEVESKMLSALLSGVNRAYPYAGTGDEKVKEQMDTLFKVVHLVRFNTAVQALMLLFQVMDSQKSISDRYYVALYKKLTDPGLASSCRQTMFLNLLYKSLKADIVLRRVKAFVKRLLQVSADQGSSFACGALFLVSEVMKAKPGLQMLLREAGDLEEEEFKDQPEEREEDEYDDEEERFVDTEEAASGEAQEAGKTPPKASWVHHQNAEGGQNWLSYDPLHRNPLFCGADHTTLWELQQLAMHFHPSVSLFAKTLLKGEFILYSGDPLQDFTLIRFLDRFVFRNPKQLKGKQNTDSAVLQPKQKLPLVSLPVNSEEFLSKNESQIPVDEIFFYRYFKKRQQEKRLHQPRGDDDNESAEDVDDDEFEKVLDSYEGDSSFPDLPVENLDFAGNVKNKKGQKHGSDSEDSDMDDLDDEEVSLGSMDEEDFGDELEDKGGVFMDLDGGDEEDDEEVPELDEEPAGTFEALDEEPGVSPPKRKRKSSEGLDFSGSRQGAAKKKRKNKKGMSDRAVMASADEFGSLLDENAGSKFDNVGLNAMANTDQAGLKQIKWEAQRDDWIHGRDAKTLRRKKFLLNKRKPFGRMLAKGMGKKKKKKN